MMDGLYLGTCFRVLSAIAKAESKKTPIFCYFLEYSQCLMVDRDAGGSRGVVIQQIKDRIEAFEKSKDDSVFPLLVFP